MMRLILWDCEGLMAGTLLSHRAGESDMTAHLGPPSSTELCPFGTVFQPNCGLWHPGRGRHLWSSGELEIGQCAGSLQPHLTSRMYCPPQVAETCDPRSSSVNPGTSLSKEQARRPCPGPSTDPMAIHRAQGILQGRAAGSLTKLQTRAASCSEGRMAYHTPLSGTQRWTWAL